jgi:formylglycine-generating enzyme required for sulfatase activity
MRLFISYARVDRPLCVQIVRMLDAHDVWYDHRIHAGQRWWDKIQRKIAACEGFVYLISPESASSIYCQKEFAIAQELGKHIIPVLIHPEAELPKELESIHYADLTQGLTPVGVKQLLNAVHVAERANPRPAYTGGQGGGESQPAIPTPQPRPKTPRKPCDPVELMSRVAEALDAKDYDRVVFLLKQAKEDGCETRFVNIEAMLHIAETQLERQTYLREAARAYKPLVSMVRDVQMRRLGCKSFQIFREQFPDYDPYNIASVCSAVMMPMLEWCEVSAGEVTLNYEQKSVTYFVDSFCISKYPITNAQFQAFLTAPDGYANPKWWDFSPQAKASREQFSKPLEPRFAWGDHPRGNVSWYEAMAFCAWMSEKTGLTITLPTDQQWQRAAQGDDGRQYPWGDKFNKNRCNTREYGRRTTCSVKQCADGASPFGVFHMAGNVWQWCDSTDYAQRGSGRQSGSSATNQHIPRAVRGGSFISVAQRARSTFLFYLNPLYRYPTIGFRVMTPQATNPLEGQS